MTRILRRLHYAAIAWVVLAGGAAAQSNYPYPVPPAGDCEAMLAAGGVVIAGSFSGTYTDAFDRRRLLYAEGCFTSEADCRRWVNEVQSFAVDPGLMRCRRIG